MDHVIQEGRDAFTTGAGMRHCPYKDAGRRDAWLKGFQEARQASRSPE